MLETFNPGAKMYDPEMIRPMCEELTAAGFEEAHTAEEVDRALARPGAILAVVNSVCGCAAGAARPGIVAALRGRAGRPDALVTVFAGQDKEATARLRERLAGFPASSPSMAIFRDGRPVWFFSRGEIQGRSPEAVAAALSAALLEHAGTQVR
jgi:putative YphP/YqiW family bacilliredoxin